MFPLADSATVLLLLGAWFAVTCLSQAPGSSDAHLPTDIELQKQEVERFLRPGLGASVLLLEPVSGALFVGARGAVLRFPAANISSKPRLEIPWEANDVSKEDCTSKGRTEDECHNHVRALHLNGSRLLACGTGAFSPVCEHFDPEKGTSFGKVDMKNKFAYNPAFSFCSVLAGGDLYLATIKDFLGREPDIFRIDASHAMIKMQEVTTFLNDPVFVASELVSSGGEQGATAGSHVYFFFTEAVKEFDYVMSPRVTRVARVCTGDKGGKTMLLGRWTSFVKLRLECSVAELKLPFSILYDVSTLRVARANRSDDGGDTRFYALFSVQWGELPYSAVCEYTLSDVEAAFARSITKTVNIESGGSSTPTDLRRGTCITPELRSLGVKSSQDLPDEYLAWMSEMPKVQDKLAARGGSPLFWSLSEAYTRVATAWATALDNRTHLVLYLGTRNGSLHKAVRVDGETRVVSRTQLFARDDAVRSIVVSAATGWLYVAASSGVAQLSLHGCAAHGGCERCLRARDPFCAWDPMRSLCSAVRAGDPPRNLVQRLDEHTTLCNVRSADSADRVPWDSADRVPAGGVGTLVASPPPQRTDVEPAGMAPRAECPSSYYGAMVTGWMCFVALGVALLFWHVCKRNNSPWHKFRGPGIATNGLPLDHVATGSDLYTSMDS